MQNNTNNLFSLVSSNLSLQSHQINYHICLTSLPGCIINAQKASFLQMKSSSFVNMTSKIEEGNIYVDSSIIIIESIKMFNLKTPKKGSCISSYNCFLKIINSEFQNYDLNCIYAFQSNFTINYTIFDNSKNKQNNKKFNYGSIFSSSSNQIIIFNSCFIENSNVVDGSALYIVATHSDILSEIYIRNSSFYGNSAFGKGTIYIYNQNFSIAFSNFNNNIAQNGGGIYCNNDGLIIIKFYNFVFYINLKKCLCR